MQVIMERWIESQKGTPSTCCSPCNTPVTFPDSAGSATNWPSRREDILRVHAGQLHKQTLNLSPLSQCSSNPWGGGNKTTRTHDKDAPLPSLHSSTTSDCGSPHLNSKIQPSPYQENHIYVQVEESDPFLQSVQCWAYKLFTSSLLQKKDRKTYPKTCCKKEKIL